MSRTPDRDRSLDRMIEAALRERGTDLPPVDTSGCIDPERLATWSEGGLSIAESRQVEAHLSTCARCQSMAAAFARSTPALAPRVAWYRRWEVRWLTPALAGAAAVAMVVWMREPVARPAQQAPAPQAAVARADAPEPKKEAAPIAENQTAPPRLDAKPRERAESRAQAAPTAPPPNMPPAALGQALPEMRQLPPPSAPAQTAVTPPAAAAAPPPPAAPATVSTAAEIQARSGIVPMRDAVAFRDSKLADASAVVLEFTAPEGAGFAPAAGAGRGGGGRGGGGAARQVAAAPALPLRWRVLASGKVSRSVDGGATWTPVELDSALHITHGAAPAARVCWLVGRAGAVMLSTDGASFRRVAFPAAIDLASIRATSERDATITSSDRRTFTTADGGVTWRQ